jgi:hypothetical protein
MTSVDADLRSGRRSESIIYLGGMNVRRNWKPYKDNIKCESASNVR